MKTLFTQRCSLTGETQSFICCDKHAKDFIVNDLLSAEVGEDSCDCEFCESIMRAANKALATLNNEHFNFLAESI